jgi:hypothetical protein
VLKVFLAYLQLQHLFDYRREVSQRTDRAQWRRTRGPHHSPRGSQRQCVFDRFQRHAAFVQLSRQEAVRTADGAACAWSRTVSFQKPADVVGLLHESGLGIAQRRTVCQDNSERAGRADAALRSNGFGADALFFTPAVYNALDKFGGRHHSNFKHFVSATHARCGPSLSLQSHTASGDARKPFAL